MTERDDDFITMTVKLEAKAQKLCFRCDKQFPADTPPEKLAEAFENLGKDMAQEMKAGLEKYGHYVKRPEKKLPDDGMGGKQGGL